MPLKSLSPVFAILSIFVASISSAEVGGKVGGWEPINNPDGPRIVEGKFAVAEHDKQTKAALEFVSVVRGERQLVAGLNYRLVISAKDGGAALENTYQAVVWDQPWHTIRRLISFEEIEG